MSKRSRDVPIPQQEQYALKLAQSGNFVELARFFECVTISDDVARKVLDILYARINKLCADFELTQAAFITEMNDM
jgi:hypothetical protein